MKSENIYIMSIEGARIWEHINREKELFTNYGGMVPKSLELTKLIEAGLKWQDSKKYNKTVTDDIINVNFKQKVKSADEIIKILKQKNKDEKDEKKKEEREKNIEKLVVNKNSHIWKEVKTYDADDEDGLRTLLYTNGFTLEINNKKIEYVVYSRTSAKSRIGKVLFIKKQLKGKMTKWKRLGMNLDGREDVDFAGLLAYESLVSSSIKDTIKINPQNILILSDVKSIFKINCNVVGKDENGKLVSKQHNDYDMENDIFDGEGLLDSSYFTNGKSMMLLRQHMFKCCVFNTNVQSFLKDYADENGIDFETWEIENMFNQKIFAKDIHLITTPNSLKALKFANVKGSEKKMWNCWKEKVEADKNIFGICKSEEKSKHGEDEYGKIMQQTSYQMLNSMPFNKDDVGELAKFELEHIDKLKNDDGTYVEYLKENANKMNCNEMLFDLFKRNSNIANTKLFKEKRKKDINNRVTHVKKGKIRLSGDYTTIVGNGLELLYHAIGELPVLNGILQYDSWKDRMVLKGNEVYTTLHPFGAEYVGFRNPHTSPSNVLVVENKNNNFIEKYFNLNDNIIYTNAIDFPLQRILSGQDLDSDSLVLFNENDKMLEVAKECYIGSSKYRVCVNAIETSKNLYTILNRDMAKIDNTLSKSQRQIGKVVNMGARYISQYWDTYNKGGSEGDLQELLEKIDIATVLGEIAIDQVKRMYDIDVEEQITHLEKCGLLDKEKPLFFKNISKNKYKKKKKSVHKKYETTMDYLQEIMDNLLKAKERDTLQLEKMVIDVDTRKVKNRQVEGIIKAIMEMTSKIKYIKTTMLDDDNEKEKYNAIDNVINEHMQKVERYKIKKETVCAIVEEVIGGDYIYKMEILNALYNADKETFLEAFRTTGKKG
ncbi:phage related protein [Alkaliphilus metalliredigens QYMF]|uniref:Phage related protein n=1 Tax=Alkaliphilus metalliredigens (strain QYMF) TaxID=293826 RepID=A6TS34_ALKMQ|nr:hypothetical protein [Alkaliphilus metalliredigens]ABR49002.1 phage related protein [Alkaliphilus metalliredigens QYMF]